MFRQFLRRLSERSLHSTAETVEQAVKDKHVFKRISNWKSNAEFVDTLVHNVIYNEGGLLMINKPYGVGKEPPIRDNLKAHRSQIHFGDGNFLSDVLPDLAAATGHENLSIIKAPERYSSGVTLLAGDSEVESRVKSLMKQAKDRKVFTSKYWVLSLGKPKCKEELIKVAIKQKISPNEKQSVPVIITSWSRNDSKLRRVKTVLVKHKLLINSNLVSLVQIEPSRTKSNFIRLYMATHLMSPILGDNICGSRVQLLLKNFLLVDLFSPTMNTPQKIPKEVLDLLNLNYKQSSLIPTHIHLQSVTLPEYFGKENNLTVEAPIPESFIWSAHQLGIEISEEDEERLFIEGR